MPARPRRLAVFLPMLGASTTGDSRVMRLRRAMSPDSSPRPSGSAFAVTGSGWASVSGAGSNRTSSTLGGASFRVAGVSTASAGASSAVSGSATASTTSTSSEAISTVSTVAVSSWAISSFSRRSSTALFFDPIGPISCLSSCLSGTRKTCLACILRISLSSSGSVRITFPVFWNSLYMRVTVRLSAASDNFAVTQRIGMSRVSI